MRALVVFIIECQSHSMIFIRILLQTKPIATNAKRFVHNKIMDIVEETTLESYCKKIPPVLANNRHKGQSGRIGVIGGSLEYTGAPYFAGMSSLKVGADICHIFCTKDAASVIKSYSPELIVHPLLDNLQTAQNAVEWIERLHVVIVGPGLGRTQNVFDATTVLLNECKRLKKPLVIDADGLFLISQFPHVIENYPADLILTPNAVEFTRLFKTDIEKGIVDKFGKKCTVLRKGEADEIFDSVKRSKCTAQGSPRRCGGQGDLLSGSVATFLCWALNQEQENIPRDLQSMVACYAACKLTRNCSATAFKVHARSMTTSNMIEQIGIVFNNYFENK